MAFTLTLLCVTPSGVRVRSAVVRALNQLRAARRGLIADRALNQLGAARRGLIAVVRALNQLGAARRGLIADRALNLLGGARRGLIADRALNQLGAARRGLIADRALNQLGALSKLRGLSAVERALKLLGVVVPSGRGLSEVVRAGVDLHVAGRGPAGLRGETLRGVDRVLSAMARAEKVQRVVAVRASTAMARGIDARLRQSM